MTFLKKKKKKKKKKKLSSFSQSINSFLPDRVRNKVNKKKKKKELRQVKRMIGGIGDIVYSTYSQTLSCSWFTPKFPSG